MTNLDDIMELRVELASCLSRRERAQIERELKAALAAQAEAERGRAARMGSRPDEAPPT